MSDLNTLTDARLKLLLGYFFGCCLGMSLFVLALVIAVAKVHEDSSFGLPFVLGAITTLAGGFTHWAFGEAIKTGTSNGVPAPPAAPK